MPRTTDRRGSGFRASLLVLGLLNAFACRRTPPPFETFGVSLDAPLEQRVPKPTPPDNVLRPWRVWINQEEPRQKKAPAWHGYGAKEGVELELAADGKWRCLLNPVRVAGRMSEHGKIGAWLASRSIRCSSDGYRTKVEGQVHARFRDDGTEAETSPSAPLYLYDTVDGQPRVTVVVLEGERVVRRPAVD